MNPKTGEIEMKKSFVFYFVIGAIFLNIHCGGGDNPVNSDPIVPAELVGTWNAIMLEFTRISDPSEVVEAVSERQYTAEIVINADGSSVTTETIPDFPPFVRNASFVVTGNTIVTAEEDGYTQTFTYSVNGDTLSLISDNVGFDFEEAVIDVPATFIGIFLRV